MPPYHSTQQPGHRKHGCSSYVHMEPITGPEQFSHLPEAYLTRNANVHMGKSSPVHGGQGKKTMASSTWLIKLEIASGGKF